MARHGCAGCGVLDAVDVDVGGTMMQPGRFLEPRPITVELRMPERRAYTEKHLDFELRMLAKSLPHDDLWDVNLFRAAYSLGGLVLAGALSRDGIAAALDMVCDCVWPARDKAQDRATIQRGLAAAKPRTIPEQRKP